MLGVSSYTDQGDSTWGGTLDSNKPLTVTDNLTLASGAVRARNTNGARTSNAGIGSQWTGGALLIGSRDMTNIGTLTLGSSKPLLMEGGISTNSGTIDDPISGAGANLV
jgi:hypothetical protein